MPEKALITFCKFQEMFWFVLFSPACSDPFAVLCSPNDEPLMLFWLWFLCNVTVYHFQSDFARQIPIALLKVNSLFFFSNIILSFFLPIPIMIYSLISDSDSQKEIWFSVSDHSQTVFRLLLCILFQNNSLNVSYPCGM